MLLIIPKLLFFKKITSIVFHTISYRLKTKLLVDDVIDGALLRIIIQKK